MIPALAMPGGAFEGASGHFVHMMHWQKQNSIIEHNTELVKLITEIENGEKVKCLGLISKLKERLALFKLTSDAMAKVQTRDSSFVMYIFIVPHSRQV